MKRVPYLSGAQIEAIAHQVLSDFGFNPDAPVIRPVPVEEIVEFHYDLHICWEVIDQLDESGLVMAAIVPGERRIILNDSCKELFESKLGTYHFTLAHELGHWVLHASGDYGQQPYHCRSADRKPPEEIQADLFAGCLLMPRPMMARAVRQLGRWGRIQLSELYGLADYLQVSISALTVRLSQLGLLTVDRNGRVRRPDQETAAGGEQMVMEL